MTPPQPVKCETCKHPEYAHKKTNKPGQQYCTRDYCECSNLKVGV